MFLKPDQFPFISELEENWTAIRAEYEALLGEGFTAWPDKQLYDKGWSVFGFYFFGDRRDQNCRRCPETTRLVEAIPGMMTAGFSRLTPQSHIKPHTGYTSAVLRCHLGVKVPVDCSLKVGSELREWQDGKCLVFDDTVIHEAWNNSDFPRTVLLIDFKRQH
ncbi:MAG: aspartyl/asparaginyl beta-hydroxylase domain-containing protein [Arenicella sp.]|nr:aspartyl/asparaginyl beta-hydroxylase domain-containing protein [Arenicella sp.]